MIFNIIDINPDNITDRGVFCIKDKKNPGQNKKVKWFLDQYPNGLRMKIAVDENEKQIGFIEYIPAEFAWRPIRAKGYLFIHCIALFVSGAKGKGIGSQLIQHCNNEALATNKKGICAMSSNGVWMANSKLFLKNGFISVDKKGRFELMSKSFDDHNTKPYFIDWVQNQKKYKGWYIIYSDQCPWHEKSVNDISQCADNHNIDLNVFKINTSHEAQKAPSGFGTFSLIKDGKILADHYISKTRFENIVKQEFIGNQ